MCYQCSGCGRCLNKDTTAPGVTRCPCCRSEVPDGERRCPRCGAYIRPAPGSVAARRPRPGAAD